MMLLRFLKKLLSQVNSNGVDSLSFRATRRAEPAIDRLRLAIRNIGECEASGQKHMADAEMGDELSFVRKFQLARDSDVIDYEMIAKLRQFDDGSHGDTRAELIGLFLELAPKRIENLKRALSEKNWHALSREAHSLKASSANLGVKRLSAVCRKLETIENHPDYSMADQLVSEIEAEFRMASRSLTELLKQRQPALKASA